MSDRSLYGLIELLLVFGVIMVWGDLAVAGLAALAQQAQQVRSGRP